MSTVLTTIVSATPGIYGETIGIKLVFRDNNSKTYSTLADFSSNNDMEICAALLKLTGERWACHLPNKKVRLIFKDNKVIGFAHETDEKLTVMLGTPA